MSRPTRLLLVRHGQIHANIERVWHGSTDSALTEIGRAQAERAAAFLARAYAEAEVLYASPLQRCQKTAEPIAAALGLTTLPEPGIAEWGIGELEGEPYTNLMETGFFGRVHSDPSWAPPGGESLHEVRDRYRAALQGIASRHPGACVVAVSHGAASAIGLADLFGDLMSWRERHGSNCGVTEVELGATPRIVRFDQTDHLD